MNGYLAKKKAAEIANRQAVKQTHAQFMTDTFMLVLNDPEVMGKDVFGKTRLKKIVNAWGKVYDKYHEALEATKESDCYQEALDRALRAIMGDELVPFGERYEWVAQPRYDKKR